MFPTVVDGPARRGGALGASDGVDRFIKLVNIVIVLQELGDVLVLYIVRGVFRDQVGQGALDLVRRKLVAPRLNHQFGVALGEGVGASPKVDINRIRSPAAKDLDDVFAHPCT